MAAPNIINTTSITCKTSVLSVSTDATNIVENSSSSNQVFKINSLVISNIDASSNGLVTATFFRSSTDTHIVKQVEIPTNSAFTAIDKSISIYLEEGDSLRLLASANSLLEAVCSYEIIE